MARRKRPKTSHSSSPISVGNCKVEIDGVRTARCEHRDDDSGVIISFSGAAKIKISVDRSSDFTNPEEDTMGRRLDGNGENTVHPEDCSILLVNPKEKCSNNDFVLQEILEVYRMELPSMNFAANTGKKSQFLERCVSNGRYKTLVLRSAPINKLEEVIAAFSFQIVPSDTQFAEIPVAAVNTAYQNKGFGRYLLDELKRRLRHVGVSTIICWADKESEGFWLKQGFDSVGNVDSKGRGRRLPIKAEIRRSLCFPGGSTLMITHISTSVPISFIAHDSKKKICSVESRHSEIKELRTISDNDWTENRRRGNNIFLGIPTEGNQTDDNLDASPWSKAGSKGSIPSLNLHCQTDSTDKWGEKKIINAGRENCFNFDQCAKKRVWESSVYSLNSKRVKGSFCNHCSLDSTEEKADGSMLNQRALHQSVYELSGGVYPTVMLMDIADENKKTNLTEIVENLGGSVTGTGGVSTHVITRKARTTLNFCIALCSGALVVSSQWLKESYRKGKFLDGFQFLLEDTDYELKYKSPLKAAVLKAKANPCALFKGYQICISRHIRPPSGILSQIVNSAGGTVIRELDESKEPTRTIFLTSEEDMDEAFAAAEEGVWTYSSEWFMNCIMKQEVDFEAPQFAESL